MRVGTKIREIRTAKGWTQETLAEKLGMNQIMISQYENGIRVPKIGTLNKFAVALDVPLEEFTQCYLGSEEESMAKIIGKKIAEARKAKGMGQAELAIKMNTTHQCVSQYERGKRCPTMSMLDRFASALGVPVETLLPDNMAGNVSEEEKRGIGKLIKEYRKEKGLTQKELAERIGVAEITIRQYEADKYRPGFDNMIKIMGELELEPAQVLPKETSNDRRDRMKLIKLTTLTGKQIYINPAYLCAVGSKPAYHVEHGEVITDTGTQTVLTFIGGSITVKEPLNEVIEKVCGEQC